MLGFQENQSFLPRYAKELSIHPHCMWITETINKWMERMAVRGVFSPLSGIICENVNWYSACEGNLDCLGKCQGILETSCCGNHVLHVHVVMPQQVHHYSECSVPVEYDRCKLSGLSPRFFMKLYLDEASSNRGQTGAKFVSVIFTLFQCTKVNAHENKFSNGSFHRNDGQA